MLKIENTALQAEFDGLVNECSGELQETLKPILQKFDGAVVTDSLLMLTALMLREGMSLDKFDRQTATALLLKVQMIAFNDDTEFLLAPQEQQGDPQMQRQFNREVAECAAKVANKILGTLREYHALVAANGLFVVSKAHLCAAHDNGYISKEMAQEFVASLKRGLLPDPGSLN